MANPSQTPLIEQHLRRAGFLIALGLAIQLITFIWIHPLAFIAFAVIGCPLVAAGVLLYLYSLVSHHDRLEAQVERRHPGDRRQAGGR